MTTKLYHRTSWIEARQAKEGDILTLVPGTQCAEGKGVYFSEGQPVRPSTAEGLTCDGVIIEMVPKSTTQWWKSKGAKARKFNKPRTWHSKGLDVTFKVIGRELNTLICEEI